MNDVHFQAPPKQCSFAEHVSQLRLTADGVLKEHLAYASERISHAMAVPDGTFRLCPLTLTLAKL